MVWKVTGGRSCLYLAGSIHVLKPADYPLPSPYEEAYQAAQVIVMEVRPGELTGPKAQGRMLRASMIDDGGSLRDRLSPDAWSRLRHWCSENQYPISSLERMQPWMASLVIGFTTFEKLGYDRAGGMEAHFAPRIERDGKSVTGLETADFQISLFSEMSAAEQEQMVLQSLHEVEEAESRVSTMVTAWRTGDTDALHKLLKTSFAKFPELEKRLLLDRNQAWISPIESLLKSDLVALVLVGAGHLSGPGSVVDLLRKKGYHIEQLRQSGPVPVPAPATPPATPAAPPPQPEPKAA